MIDRLTGLVMTINSVLPGIFLVLVLASSILLWRAFERGVAPKIGEISDGLSSLKAAAEEAVGYAKRSIQARRITIWPAESIAAHC